jgi:DNA processing protein
VNELFYQIALRQTDYIGDITAKNLINHFGKSSAVFECSNADLQQVIGIGDVAAKAIKSQHSFEIAEREMNFIAKNNIQTFFYQDEKYPTRLKRLEGAPFLLFYKGNADFNIKHALSVVGTRKPTEQGKRNCEQIISGLIDYKPLIISGLAYGIDVTAHKKALALGLATIGVVAHGLDMIYPAIHQPIAEQMIANGGIISEFITQTEPNRENFPMRNRIIAAMAEAVLVVETARTGGSIITAELANDYQKDVFAIAGRLDDEFSQGCNWLIKTHKASLLESWEDIVYLLRWDKLAQQKTTQVQLFQNLSSEEQKIVDILRTGQVHLDLLVRNSGFTVSKLASILLDLEFNAIVKPLAGKNYILC